MKAIINQLVQLQELHLSRREQEAGTPGADLKQLDDSIAEMMANLPPEVEKAGYTKVTRAVLNPAKLEGLGWSARYDLREGLEATYQCCKG